MPPFSTADLLLAARIEAADAANVMALAEASQGAIRHTAVQPVGGGVAVFSGVGSPMTHAMGIGMKGHVPVADLERMEAFFRDRGSSCLIDLSSLADASVIAFVQSRPYSLVEFNNVMVRAISPHEHFSGAAGVRPIAPDESRKWARVVIEGFSEHLPVDDAMLALMESTCGAIECWLAEDAVAVGGAAMGAQNNIALLTGDAVLLPARKQGWQRRLIQARLAAAQMRGCDLAVACVLPGSGSHRNYERAGFQLLYTRINIARHWT
ncbi:MAG: hypothetical protein JO270_14310 [Acidobacteriaceae bacterium]|nr:hypothetical protein [Acidobacteriaceae bacterium]